ncbi:cation-translocating P-type ATPase [Nocardioides lijunqiniae]|uniref:cation-translocating P-type ATPase n=1 Tax=Nocardioides lijunqiniae TaxID=2760832 RepID=UPI001878A95A|nr:HAD-IC family P-type ATPase [Nocardioides lijunqiniae]
MAHHALPPTQVLLVLGADPETGLAEDEAARRLAQFGPNELPAVKPPSAWLRMIRQMDNPLIYVLLVAGLVTVFLGEYVDASVIFGVVVVNTVVGFIQESKAESALEALRSMVHTDARILRDGVQRLVPSGQLVPGDVVLMEAGDKLPADLRLIQEADLSVDESALTGESLPVAKDEGVVLPESTAVADRKNMAYSGTLVTAGTGVGVVVATGADTELGAIHRLVSSAKSLATPLTRQLASFSTLLTVVILVLAAITFAVGVLRGEPAAQMFTAAVALAVGAIPEGLPAAVTVTLAIGVARMARRGAVIRRLPAVETLGGATIICTDKTGTLTENRMTVQALWSLHEELRVPEDTAAGTKSAGVALTWCLKVGANCNDSRLTESGAQLGDPTETAMLTVAQRYGISPHALPRVESSPFNSERMFMATSHLDPDSGRTIVFAKGAVERILELCTTQLTSDGTAEPLDAEAVLAATDRLSADGMRVLATAVDTDAAPDAVSPETAPAKLAFAGLQAMHDPPRATATEAVARCRDAGLAVKMITGDHAVTAGAIGRQVGLLDADDVDRVLTGAELEQISLEELPEAAERTVVFARVSPEQKLRLVEALQSRGHVVAMTGDGVNDAPALKQADIGVAMGLGGTEVAKDAGDMVLTDDDFATIEAAVEEGRGVFDNLTKFIVWTLPTNVGEALVILVAVFLGSQLPILPTQILWINMTTAVVLGLTLAWEPREEGIMTRPPRSPGQSLLTRALVYRTLFVSALLVAGSSWAFHYELSQGASVETSRTVAVNVFVVAQILYLISCRSLSQPIWRIGWFTNRWLVVGILVQILGQLALTYVPIMNDLFQTAPLSVDSWLRVVAAAVAVWFVVSLDKYLRHRRDARPVKSRTSDARAVSPDIRR